MKLAWISSVETHSRLHRAVMFETRRHDESGSDSGAIQIRILMGRMQLGA